MTNNHLRYPYLLYHIFILTTRKTRNTIIEIRYDKQSSEIPIFMDDMTINCKNLLLVFIKEITFDYSILGSKIHKNTARVLE